MTTFVHRLLGCRIGSIEFPDAITCRLVLPSGNCTDMSGAIKVATAVTKHLVDFTLLRIETVARGAWPRETVYVREFKKSPWKSLGEKR